MEYAYLLGTDVRLPDGRTGKIAQACVTYEKDGPTPWYLVRIEYPGGMSRLEMCDESALVRAGELAER